MITDKEKFFESTSAGNIISRELAENLYKATKLEGLKKVLEKKVIVVPASLRDEIIKVYEAKVAAMAVARANRKGVGGRKRLPDPPNPELLTGAEKIKWQNRNWQRQFRERKRREATA